MSKPPPTQKSDDRYVGSCGACAEHPNGFLRVDSTNGFVEQNHVGHVTGGFDNCLKPRAGDRYSEPRRGELRLSNVTRDGVAISNQDKRRERAPERGRRPDTRWCARWRSRDRRAVPVHVDPREQECCLIDRTMCVEIRGAGSAIRGSRFAVIRERFEDSGMGDSRILDSEISDQ